MTDRSGSDTQHAEQPKWRVEGSTQLPPEDHGLNDTVVRMPKIPADLSAPTPNLPPKAPSGAAAPVPAPPPAPNAAGSAEKNSGLRRTRKARLRLSRLDPWSVMKTSFLFSIAFGIMFWVATWVLWNVVMTSGLFEAINDAVANIIANPSGGSNWQIEDVVNTNKVLGITALLAVINVVISTALGTLTAFLYNLSANILGGLELTLAED